MLIFLRQTRSLADAGIRKVRLMRFLFRLGVSLLMTITPGSSLNHRCIVSDESFHSLAISITVNTSSLIHVVGSDEQMGCSGS